MADVVIRGGRLIDARAHAAPLADVLVRDDTIVEVGASGLPAPGDARVLDARGKLLIPGLINAHTHSHSNLGRGMVDRYDLQLLLNAAPWLGGNRTVEDKYLSALIGAAEMARKGVTACYDLFFEFPAPTLEGLQAVGQAYADVGIRAVVAPMMADRTFYQAIPGLLEALPAALGSEAERMALGPWEASIEACRAVLRAWKFDREQVALALGPTIPLHCSDEFIRGCRDLAREAGVGVHMHLAESKVQALSGLARYGQTLTAHLDALGLLGPSFTAAHAIWLDADDIGRLADRGASVAHNPGSNLRLGSGIAAVRRMLDRGVNVGVGTDGVTCSDNQNMFEAMRLASLLSRIQGPDWSRWLATDEALTLATEGSARALGFGGRLGRVAPGYRADLVLLDAGHVNYVPLNDPVNQVVNVEDGTAVHSVMVGGRLIVDAGRLTTVDAGGLAARAEAAVSRLREVNEPVRRLVERLHVVVGSFCRGLGARPYHAQRWAATEPSV
jgi:guanine deaminase